MKDYKKILEGVVDIINATEKSDIGFVNICTYIGENCPELKESEDEEIRKFLIQMAQNGHGEDRDWWNKCVDWLEKQGEQKPAEWSKEDERNFDIIYGIIYNSCNAEDASRLIEWLKVIKDRVQPKHEWGEEDEKMFSQISDILWEGYKNTTGEMPTWDNIREWCLSIKDRIQHQPTWSPSDEQVEAFEHFVRSIGESGYASPYDNNTKLLYSLLSDLKKLKG